MTFVAMRPGRGFSLFMLAVALLLPGCSQESPLVVGFAGQLTGPQADLGVQGRNGAILAVETLNASGGLGGRPLELIAADDAGTPEGARAAVAELASQGVSAIVGLMTSGQSVAALPTAKEHGLVLVSPTTSTDLLQGKKDLFFRVQPMISTAAHALAEYIRRELKMQSVGIVYDSDNQAYSDAYMDAFVETFTRYGGKIAATGDFSASQKTNYLRLLARVMEQEPQGVLVIASAFDAAIIAQTFERGAWMAQLLFAGWAQTDKFLYMGGKAVQGCLLVSDFDPQNTSPKYLDFRRLFSQRFGKEPSFAAAKAYDAVMLLARALERAGLDTEKLPHELPAVETFAGVSGDIRLDEYGDVVKSHYLLTVQDNEFLTLEALPPLRKPDNTVE